MIKLIKNSKIFYQYEYYNESIFEQDVAANAEEIFGKETLYINMKKKVGNTIPDGYLLDFTVEGEPHLFFIEAELSNHDLYSHILPQMLKFSDAFKYDKNKIINLLFDEISGDTKKMEKVNENIKATKYGNLKELLTSVVYDNEIEIIIVINKKDTKLISTLEEKINMEIGVVEFETYISGNEVIHKIDQDWEDEVEGIEDLKEYVEIEADDYELDTMVVAADEEGFQDTFLGENCWYRVRMSEKMRAQVRYIAVYIMNPVASITHYAVIDRIEEYEDGGYIVYFKGKPKKVGPILRGEDSMVMRPRLRYTTYEKLVNAEIVEDLFDD